MKDNTLRMIEELTKMDEKEREAVLKQFVKNNDEETCQEQTVLADEAEQADVIDEMRAEDAVEEMETCDEDSGEGCISYDDSFTKEDYVVGGTLLAGTGIAAGLLGVLLDNKTLKTTGVVGTILGSVVVIANKEYNKPWRE